MPQRPALPERWRSRVTNIHLAFALVALAACNGDTNANDASIDTPPADTGSTDSGADVVLNEWADSATDVPDASHPIVDAGQPFEAFRPCNAESDYVEGSSVAFDNSFTYTPACIFIRRGGTVTFEGDFAAHPLVPSTRGTSGSPITMTNTGTTATFTFANAGFYPYYCLFHGADQGAGMSGVVQVGP